MAQSERTKGAVALLEQLWTGEPWGGKLDPIAVALVMVFPRQKSKPAGVPSKLWRTGRRIPGTRTPDIDNASGAVLDALTKAGVLTDDAFVTHLTASMWWAAIGEPEHIEVCISRLGEMG